MLLVAAVDGPSLLSWVEAPPRGCRTGRGGGQRELLELCVCVCVPTELLLPFYYVCVLYYSNAAHQWPERGERGGKACLHRLQTAWGIMQERK